ncbi:methylmalonyl-CoA mutase [Vulgatibacter sp.]|uniref:acyl-CoA mutase large subunit family protein n=1 Tax=Vulgatibacter sp. TaxID=1971226 RepID=UPI003562EB87
MADETRKKIQGEESRWLEQTWGKAVKKFPERQPKFETSSGVELPPVVTPAGAPPEERYLERIGFPGEYPFTRGVQPTMYRGRHWTMRQYAGFASATESNRRYKYLLQSGTTGLSVAFDLPTQMGRDADHPRARGEVGRVGVSISSIEDMAVLMADLPMEDLTTSMTINATSSILLAFYAVHAQERGFDIRKLGGTIQNDLLKEYIARGTYIYPPAPSLRIITDLFAFTSREMPRWNPISISGYHIREAGSTAAQEIAFTLADGITYVQAALDAGLDVDAFAGRLSFFFNVHNDFLEEIAKFRAARRLWARIMKERFKAKDPRSCMLRFHSQTAGSTLTAQQPENNVVRVALQALASVLGGTQSLHTNSKDEALALPSESSAKLALRTQQIIANESGVADVIDPLGGSWHIERLTDELEEKALAYIQKIDDMGGMVNAISEGYPQREIQDAAFRYQTEIERGERVIVGVNEFVEEKEVAPADLLKIDPAIEAQQKERLAELRKRRDADQAARALDAVRAGAGGTENLIPLIFEAVRARCTLGEISDAMREVFGEHREEVVL